jgi:NAD(P)-dependent dehydrogenase (short-subunit alcohol dehydrogenase family)
MAASASAWPTLAEAGAGVCIWGTNEAKNEAASEKLRRHGGRVHAQIVDVADEAAVETAFAETLNVMGRVDNCVANSGVPGSDQSFMEFTTAVPVPLGKGFSRPIP